MPEILFRKGFRHFYTFAMCYHEDMVNDKFTSIMLTTIASEGEDSVNRSIARTILQHRADFQDMGITELAKLCHVATGSISRFCRAIGLEGYSELREMIRRMPETFEPVPEDDIVEGWLDRTCSAMRQAARSLDPGQIKALCRDIRSHEKVYTCGLLKAESAALILQKDLMMLDKYIDTSVSVEDQTEHLLQAGPDELIIVFAYTGSYFAYPSMRGKARQLSVPDIWLICGSDRPQPSYVNHIMRFSSDQDAFGHPYQLEAAASLIAQYYARSL